MKAVAVELDRQSAVFGPFYNEVDREGARAHLGDDAIAGIEQSPANLAFEAAVATVDQESVDDLATVGQRVGEMPDHPVLEVDGREVRPGNGSHQVQAIAGAAHGDVEPLRRLAVRRRAGMLAISDHRQQDDIALLPLERARVSADDPVPLHFLRTDLGVFQQGPFDRVGLVAADQRDDPDATAVECRRVEAA
jgi:hypothetical protein